VSASESPLPTSRILSRNGSRRACSQAAGVSVQCKLQVLALPCLRWSRQVLRPAFSSRTDQDEQLRFLTSFHASVHFSADRTDLCVCTRSTAVFHGTSLRTVQTHLCLCTKHCGVSRRVRPVSFVDDFVVLSLTRLHFSPDFPRFASF
jgi:hypothetical protein